MVDGHEVERLVRAADASVEHRGDVGEHFDKRCGSASGAAETQDRRPSGSNIGHVKCDGTPAVFGEVGEFAERLDPAFTAVGHSVEHTVRGRGTQTVAELGSIRVVGPANRGSTSPAGTGSL